MARQSRVARTPHRQAVLAAIARREWLLQMLALGAAGCGGVGDRAYTRGNTLIVAINGGDRDALDPDNVASTLMFLPLVRINEHGEREACLATEWTHSADYLEWTYRLRPGVHWHDGTPVTVDDVKFTIDFHSRPDSPVYPTLLSECILHDASTFTVRGSGWADWDTVLAILPKHLVKDLDYQKWYDWDFWLRPIGNGPYRYLRYQPGTMIELEANPDYHRGKPSIDRVVLKFYRGASPLTDLLGGNVDAIQVDSNNATQLPVIANDARFQTYWGPLRSERRFWAIFWQNKHPLFEAADIRRALSLAIDRRALVQALNLPREFSLVDGIYTDRQRQRGEASEPRSDPMDARRLLDESGWRQRTRDGLRERSGQTFRFTALTDSIGTKTAVYVQEQFRALGVHMDLQSVDCGGPRSRVRSGEFEAAFCRMIDVGNLDFVLGKASPIAYRNPQLARVFEVLRTSPDPDAVDQAHREMSDFVRRDLPFAFLLSTATLDIVHRRVRGLSAPWHADPLMFTEDLWLQKER